MQRKAEILTAAVGVCTGSLFWDAVFGDGVQRDDIHQALAVGLVAALIQWWLSSRRL